MLNARPNDPNLTPSRPVICEVCANAGRSVEMQPDTQGNSYLDSSTSGEVPGLRTFRCPECENIQVFTVV